MAESVVKDFKGKMDWVYVGRAVPERKTPEVKKADTLFNEYMRAVLDVAAPIADAEVHDAVATQGIVAEETAKQLVPEKLLQEAGGDKSKFVEKWLAWEKKFSTPDNQNRLGKLITNAVYMGGSFGLDLLSDVAAEKLFLNRPDIPLGFGKKFFLDQNNGNKEMLKAGWEYLTDEGIGRATDWSVKKLANHEDIGFVSPLAKTLGKVGALVINVFGDLKDHSTKTKVINSFVNPGFIESAFRFTGALPGGGFVKDIYALANRQIMKGDGALPFGTDMAYNMLIAKWMNKPKV
jgi:hypothetical protein